jgi:hypothetical protein
LLGYKTQKREAARSAASLFWVLICPDTSGDSYIYTSALLIWVRKPKPKKLWRTLRVRHSFLGFKVSFAYLLNLNLID